MRDNWGNSAAQKWLFYALALLAMGAIVVAAHLLGFLGAILLVGGSAYVLFGLIRGASDLGIARASGNVEAVAAIQRRLRYFEAVCGVMVLGALAVCLLPVFLFAPGPSKKMKSLNNIKQLAIAVQMYAQDYNDTFPGWVRNPDGAYAHSCWDEQIDPFVKAKDAYNNGNTGIKSYSDPARSRVLTYGLNGLLIAPPAADGNADFDGVNATHPPEPLSPGALGNPGGTILFAELATNLSFPGLYGQAPNPSPFTGRPSMGSSQWQGALAGWIDISPRDWVANGGPAGSYHEPYASGIVDYGVARDLYTGGGVYVFCDGHAQFMKIGKSVGIGTTTKAGLKITEYNCWSPENTNNMWVPR